MFYFAAFEGYLMGWYKFSRYFSTFIKGITVYRGAIIVITRMKNI